MQKYQLQQSTKTLYQLLLIFLLMQLIIYQIQINQVCSTFLQVSTVSTFPLKPLENYFSINCVLSGLQIRLLNYLIQGKKRSAINQSCQSHSYSIKLQPQKEYCLVLFFQITEIASNFHVIYQIGLTARTLSLAFMTQIEAY